MWVKRIALSIPRLRRKIFDLMEDEDIDKFISKAIAEVCLELKLNPLRFDFGAYLIGINEFEKKRGKFRNFRQIYEELMSLAIRG